MGDNPSVVKVADPSANGAFDGLFAAPSSLLSPALAALGFPVHKEDTNSPVLTACGVGFCLGFSSPLLGFTAVVEVLVAVAGMVTIVKASGLISKLTTIASSAILGRFWKRNCFRCCCEREEAMLCLII